MANGQVHAEDAVGEVSAVPSSVAAQRTAISAVLIVKNEEAAIGPCLDALNRTRRPIRLPTVPAGSAREDCLRLCRGWLSEV